MSTLPKLSEVAALAFEFANGFNEHMNAKGLGDEFRAAATEEEKTEWRALGKNINELRHYASMFGAFGGEKSPHEEYCDHQKLRLAEIYARVGIRAFDEESVRSFVPAQETAKNTAYGLTCLGLPTLEKIFS